MCAAFVEMGLNAVIPVCLGGTNFEKKTKPFGVVDDRSRRYRKPNVRDGTI
ncbi:hypothetical protein PAT3040_00493 [Paenibacillus agaridevorans]|uniref:Uncharacterized protein n=1 Tax=Paenibacillus agaridevorans TaxID=171404 RepID=A0A2R5EHF5_9BACL|nr:hypothetical protein PAT3040_00493 [Paenibacillus agaridevorans]